MGRQTSNVKRVGLVVLAVLAMLVAERCEARPPAPVSPVSPVSPPDSHSLRAHSAPGRVSLVNPAWKEYLGEPQGGDLELLCQLRRSGGQGVVASQARLISWGRTYIPFVWDVSELDPSWYEVFCRLSGPDGTLYPVQVGAQDCVEGCGFGFVEHFKIE